MVFILAVFGILSVNCNNGDTSSETSSFTNSMDQEYIHISSELDRGNYTRVIDFIDDFFNKNSLDEDNFKILLMKVDAKEKLLKELNKRGGKEKDSKAKKYGFTKRKNRIYYDYKELKMIWKEFPNKACGMDAFNKYINNSDAKEKMNSYEKFPDNIKDKKVKNRLRLELSDIYLPGLVDFKGKKAKKLLKLYNKLLNTEYRNSIIVNSIILEYKITKNRDNYKKEVAALLNERNAVGMTANYLMGELEFIEADYKEAEDCFKRAKSMLKYVQKEDAPLLLRELEYFQGESAEYLKISISKKIRLIEKLLKYDETLKGKKIAFITGERVRIRKDPVIVKQNVISTLNYGDKVTIVKRSEKMEKLENENNYWYKIQLIDNTTGWVFGKYLLFFLY